MVCFAKYIFTGILHSNNGVDIPLGLMKSRNGRTKEDCQSLHNYKGPCTSQFFILNYVYKHQRDKTLQ